MCALFEEIAFSHLSRVIFRALYESDESKKSDVGTVVKIQDGRYEKEGLLIFSSVLNKYDILKE